MTKTVSNTKLAIATLIMLVAGGAAFVAAPISYSGCVDSDAKTTFDQNQLFVKSDTTYNSGKKTDNCYTFPKTGKTYLMEGTCNAKATFATWQKNCAELNYGKPGSDFKCVEGACVDAAVASVNPVITSQSNYFKDDPVVKEIFSKGTFYDLASIDPYQKLNGSTNFAYKIYNALIMLGYNSINKDYQPSLLTLLHRFQKNNNFSESNFLTKEMLIKIDSSLWQREIKYKSYATQFPLYDHIVVLDAENVSKDYISTLFSLPVGILPDYLQLKTVEQYVHCIKGQCVGSIKDQLGNALNKVDLDSDYVFYPDFIAVKYPTVALPTSAGINLFTVSHEYGHYIDGSLNLFKYAKNNIKDDLHPTNYIIDTEDFYKISWNLNFSPDNPTKHCAKHKNEDIADFITKYAYDADNFSVPPCPVGEYRFTEEFADSFAAYIATGKAFRNAATQNQAMKQKYDWLKKNIFQGIEYDTNLSQFGTKDCEEVLWLDCDPDYVWDGFLNKLSGINN